MKNKIYKCYFIILIFLFFTFTTVNLFIYGNDFSERENRYLAAFPQLTVQKLADGSFMKEFDSFACDRFVFRNFFVSLKGELERITLKKDNNGIHFGRNGYLIPAFEKNEAIVENNTNALIKLNETGKFSLSVCLVPTANEVKNKELPLFARNGYEKKTLNGVNGALKEKKVKVVEPLKSLLAHSNEYIYYKTDHHQTALGGYYMYESLGEALGYKPLKIESFKVKTLSENFFGTSFSKAGVTGYGPDRLQLFESDVKVTCDQGSFFDYSKLETKDKYAFFMGGNYAVATVTSSVKNGRRLAIIKDSYANNIVPFLANHFETIYMIDLRYFNGDLFEELYKFSVNDILVLQGISTFATDGSLSKITEIINSSAHLKTLGGEVKKGERVEDSYFADAVFIGDSLTDGLKLYAEAGGTFLSNTGISVTGVMSALSANGVSIAEQIKTTKGGKFYIMLGLNDSISSEEEIPAFIKNYGALIDAIKESNPKSPVYIQSLFPVSREREKKGDIKNSVIYKMNDALLKLAKEKNVYFLKVYEAVADDEGYLKEEITTDGVHLKPDNYKDWYNYLKSHAVPVYGEGKTDEIKNARFAGGGKYNPHKLAKALVEGVAFKDKLSEAGINSVKFLYGIEPESLLDGCVMAGGGSTAEEIAIFEFSGKEMKKLVEKKINERIEVKRKAYESYMPQEMAKLENPVVIITGDFAVLCICDNNKEAEKIITQFIKNR